MLVKGTKVIVNIRESLGSKSSTSFETKDIESKKMEGVARNVLDDSHSNEHVSIAPKLKAPSVRKRTRIMIVPPSEAIKAANMRQKLTGDRDTESDLKSHINRKRTRRMTETSTKADQTTHTNLQTQKMRLKRMKVFQMDALVQFGKEQEQG